ncbi:hypothetical protein J1N35_044333 [Gossypium stocksii]|uniref:Reverse transcriptase zinc-binding domain-containing protein n=1 Tax=Gossypium stocksii TaxID=47602 RepID=A0A9D3U969_9ROSI|nr:hypothetical protein J1N35_044333 [Gossypium stocksii]
MVLPNGGWNLDLFRMWLPEDIIKHIVSIPSPHPNSRPDRIVWTRTTSGTFSIRRAFWYLKEDFLTSWSSLFDIILWRIWNNKNLFIFQNITWTVDELLKVSLCWARQYEAIHKNPKKSRHKLNLNLALNGTLVHLHTDRVVATLFGDATASEVARD